MFYIVLYYFLKSSITKSNLAIRYPTDARLKTHILYYETN